eukprot:gb/GECH01008936.1/.p1 GENE.gb/GECH01008936.1/~~gb/GECH01008936.1/.p1  ORF type:complete len:101 (+),score=25.70 gb/GECH01008936.1/:1-303(+)
MNLMITMIIILMIKIEEKEEKEVEEEKRDQDQDHVLDHHQDLPLRNAVEEDIVREENHIDLTEMKMIKILMIIIIILLLLLLFPPNHQTRIHIPEQYYDR